MKRKKTLINHHIFRQIPMNLAMYAANSSLKENAFNYAHNISILEQNMPDSMPHSSVLQRKIVKSNNQYNTTYMKPPRADTFGKMLFKSNTFKDITEERAQYGLPYSKSSTSLDFLAEGERMVSDLCNISNESYLTESMPRETKSKSEYLCSKCLCNPQLSTESYSAQSTSRDRPVIYDESVSIQIIKLAVEACTAAENIAIANKNRPCFKNIQTICEKTRSNVQKPDSAVANLHSQGVPWVIKNFIFSFVRILDGWKGIKELLCEKHESFKRIETKYYNPQIRESFVEWQIATSNMLSHIYKTFKALDSGFQAEQQRYKQNANGINFSTAQKQPSKPLIATPPANPLSYNPPINQWGTNVFPHVFPLWTHPTAVTNVPLMQAVYPGALPRNDCDANKRPVSSVSAIEGLETKEEIKYTNNIYGGAQKYSGAWLQPRSKDFLSKYQQTSGSISKHEEVPKMVQESNEFQKISNVESLSLTPEQLFNLNETRESFPLQNSNCWSHENTNSINRKPVDSLKSGPQFNELEKFSNRNTFSLVPNTAFASNIISTCSFESDGEMNETSKVYMKPGSYNVPIKQSDNLPEPDFGTVETITVHNSLMNKGTVPKVLNLPFTKAPANAFPQPLFDCNSYNLNKNILPLEHNPSISIYTPDLGLNKIIPRLNQGYLNCSDKEWEAAKQMAPKIHTTMYNGPNDSKTNAQRLYEALATNQLTENRLRDPQAEETQNTLYVDSVSWNKVSQEFFGENAKPIQKSADNINEIHINKLVISSELSKRNSDINQNVEILSSAEKYGQELPLDLGIGEHLLTSSENGHNSQVSVSAESCYLERKYASCDTVKKLKKKINNLTNKSTARKKNDIPLSAGLKRMESILFALRDMDKKNESKFGLDISEVSFFKESI